jgi:hypothetical protein
MIQRIAACLALIAFSVCLLVGGLDAGNPFATTVWRAIGAMMSTLLIGLLLGTMAKAMIQENVESEREKLKNSQPKPNANDR